MFSGVSRRIGALIFAPYWWPLSPPPTFKFVLAPLIRFIVTKNLT